MRLVCAQDTTRHDWEGWRRPTLASLEAPKFTTGKTGPPDFTTGNAPAPTSQLSTRDPPNLGASNEKGRPPGSQGRILPFLPPSPPYQRTGSRILGTGVCPGFEPEVKGSVGGVRGRGPTVPVSSPSDATTVFFLRRRGRPFGLRMDPPPTHPRLKRVVWTVHGPPPPRATPSHSPFERRRNQGR